VSTWRRTKRLGALGAAVLLTALAVACGGSGSSSGIEQLRGETDSPLLEFGEEGSAGELEQATETADAFLLARAKGDWEAACAQLSQALVDKLEKLASHSTALSETSCASFLKAFIRLTPAQGRETSAKDGALRRSGERGYLLYPAAGGAVDAMQLAAEDGEWRVGAIAVRELP
jgi:hypothetical protein